jgi:ribosomal protein S18 acetylase RimI-like enzyme
MKFFLIKASEADSDFVYQLKKIVLKEYVQKTWQLWDEDFQRRFHKENYNTTHIKIIKVEETSAGTIDVREGNENIFISGLYILPQFQGKGIGSSILKELIDKAQSEKKRLELEVLRVNTDAQRLYKRLGFIMTEKDDQKYFMYKEVLSQQ